MKPSTFLIAFLCCLGCLRGAAAQAPDLESRLETIIGYTRISDDLASSGQIAYDQIPLLKEAGFDVVVNLAPAADSRNGLEGFLVTELGLSYVQIPVSWEAPSQRDLQFFFDVMKANSDRKVFVHCFANMRASAFVYLYRTLHDGISEEQARKDLARIWDPTELKQWAAFIETAQHEHGE
ncbi:MAG: protein tyrosine phosphatase family protein [Rhodothermales bacterium]